MAELVIQIAAGLVVAILSGGGGFFIKKKFFPENRFFPTSQGYDEQQGYTHLNGRWHFYWISYNPSNDARPVWMQGNLELRVKKNRVTGTIEHINHPLANLHYNVYGEIRAGRMILTDACTVNDTDYSSAFYPNLSSHTLLIGIWTGLDNLLHPIAAPLVLSRREMSTDNLNKALRGSGISLVPIGEYEAISAKAFPNPN